MGPGRQVIGPELTPAGDGPSASGHVLSHVSSAAWAVWLLLHLPVSGQARQVGREGPAVPQPSPCVGKVEAGHLKAMGGVPRAQ